MELPADAATEWADWGVWLPRATADYYVLMDCYILADQDGANPAVVAAYEDGWREHCAKMAERLCQYLVLACGGEGRHARKTFPSPTGTTHRAQSWVKLSQRFADKSRHEVGEAMEAWADSFVAAGNFHGGYGGKPWSQASRLAGQYLRDEISGVMFVELALNLHHNNAIIFNKLTLSGSYMKLLDAGFAGLNEGGWPLVKAHASEGTVDLWLKLNNGEEPSATLKTPAPSTATGLAALGGAAPSPHYSPANEGKLW